MFNRVPCPPATSALQHTGPGAAVCREYALTALAKLAPKWPGSADRIRCAELGGGGGGWGGGESKCTND